MSILELPKHGLPLDANAAESRSSSTRPALTMLLLGKSSVFKVVPAPLERTWVDRSRLMLPYRSLPRSLASQYGWVILNPSEFTARWDGSSSCYSTRLEGAPEFVNNNFGGSIITFHFDFFFRTSPGWHIWFRGLPNFWIDGAGPLEGIVETDWLPYTATMNWSLTRVGHPVVFEKNSPICFITPVQKGKIEQFQVQREELNSNPVPSGQFDKYKKSRSAFLEQSRVGVKSPKEWQRHYVRRYLDGEKTTEIIPQREISLDTFEKDDY